MSTKLPVRKFTDEEKNQWRAGLMDIYARMRDKAKNGPYETEMGGLSFVVLPDVYAPTAFTDTLWFAEQIRDIVGQKSLLEIGTGTGAISVFAALNGAQVVATDINPQAIENARLNAEKHNISVSVRLGNLYDPIAQDEKFDFIFWAHPFNNWETPVGDMLLKSGMDYQYQALRGYIEGARTHLTENGKLLLGTGDTADLETISSIAEANGYELVLLREITMPLEEGSKSTITDLLYEFKQKHD
jgi:release factor glutamine methyltransferase